MKKFITLLLVFLACLPALAEQSGPVLVPAELPGLPVGEYTSLGDGRVLVVNHNTSTYAIYNIADGSLLPLSLREEDLEGWAIALVAAYAAEGETVTQEEMLHFLRQISEAERLDAILQYIGLNFSTQDSPCMHALQGPILHVESGVLRPQPTQPSGLVYGKCTGENLVCFEDDGATLRFTLYSLDGEFLRAADFTPDALYTSPTGRLQTSGGMLFAFRSDAIDGKTRELALAFVDDELNVRPIVELGQWSNAALSPEQALFSASTGQLLLVARGSVMGTTIRAQDETTGNLTFRKEPYGPYLDGLMVVDVATGDVQCIGPELANPALLGLSADGSYALVATVHSQLYRLDLETLALTEVMSEEEMRSILTSAHPYFYTTPWDGGEYIVFARDVLRVQGE